MQTSKAILKLEIEVEIDKRQQNDKQLSLQEIADIAVPALHKTISEKLKSYSRPCKIMHSSWEHTIVLSKTIINTNQS